MTRAPRTIVAVALAGAAFLGWTIEAHAQVNARCDVLIIHGTNDDKPDPTALPAAVAGPLAQFPQLRMPPFSAYRTMRLLRRPILNLTPNVPFAVALPTGRSMAVTYLGNDPHGHLQISVSISMPGAVAYLPGIVYAATPGAPFFQAGQSYQGGVLILGFVCQ